MAKWNLVFYGGLVFLMAALFIWARWQQIREFNGPPFILFGKPLPLQMPLQTTFLRENVVAKNLPLHSAFSMLIFGIFMPSKR